MADVTTSPAPLVATERRRSTGMKKRRDRPSPYGVAGSRRGGKRMRGDDPDETDFMYEDEEDVEDHPRGRKSNSGGLFSRLVSYIPIVGKLVGDDEAEDEVEDEDGDNPSEDDTMVSINSDSDVHSEKWEEEPESSKPESEEVEHMTSSELDQTDELPEAEVLATPQKKSPVSELQIDTSVPPSNGVGNSQDGEDHIDEVESVQTEKSPESAKRSHKVSPRMLNGELGPVLRTQRRRSSEKKAFLPAKAQKSKLLKISGNGHSPKDGEGFKRNTNQRRHKIGDASPLDSPLAVIKRKKTISYDEYERLAQQLRGLVEQTPQAALALTQNALDQGLNDRPTDSLVVSSYVPGSIASRTNGPHVSSPVGEKEPETSLEVRPSNGIMPSGKRARANDTRPIYFSGNALRGQLPDRKSRPSRLLTGAKRDAAARSAYSTAVAQKILSTLNKVQNPLEREAKKPTPSTSLSWAKYHLTLVENQKSRSSEDESNRSDLPPTATIPQVIIPQVRSSQTSSATTPSSFASFNNLSKTALETPAPKSKSPASGTFGMTPMFSPQAVSMTPAIEPVVRNSVFGTKPTTFSTELKTKKVGEYSFTIPVDSNENGVSVPMYDDHDEIQFRFSPPPSQREPPKKSPSQKPGLKSHGGEQPFSFMPASPKARAEWLSKPSALATESKSAAVAETKVATPTSHIAASSASTVNPLAKFLQVEPGSWKCPTCAVTNAAKFSKCPCCETAKPSEAGVKETGKKSEPTSAKITSDVNPLAKFLQVEPGSWKCPTCSVTNVAKYSKCPCCETAKPISAAVANTKDTHSNTEGKSGKVTSSGFSFAAPSAPATSTSEASTTSAKFTFGIAPQKQQADEVISKPSFSFGGNISSKPIASFGLNPSSEKAAEPVNGFTFGGASSEKNKNEEPLKPVNAFGGNVASSTAPSFTFGSSDSNTASATPPKQNETTSKSFTFGSSEVNAKSKEATSTTSHSGAKRTSTSDSEPASKKSMFSFSKPESKPETTIPAFSFGVVGKPSVEPKKTESSFAGFSAGDDSSKTISTNEKLKDKPAFAFGVSSVGPSDVNKSVDKPSFGFGTSDSTSKTSSESKTSFTFGGSSATSMADKKESTTGGGSFGSGASSSSPAVSTTGFSVAPPKEVGTSSVKLPFAFGTSSTPSAEVKTDGFGQDSASKPSFTFGTATSTAAPANEVVPTKPSFTFGQNNDSATKTVNPAPFGGSVGSVAPAFSFGDASGAPSSGAPSTTASPPSTSFTFGATAATPVTSPPVSSGFSSSSGSSFGNQTSSAASGFGSSSTFGQTSGGFGSSSGFGNTPPTTSFGSSTMPNSSTSTSATPSFAFGAASQAPPTSTPSPAFTFGNSSTVSTGFGAPTAPLSGFGAPSASASGFGSAATPSPAFGSARSNSPAFGAPTSTGFGTPVAPSPTFGTSATGSTGFGAPADAFGRSSTPPFGAPTPTTTFGGSSANTTFGSAGFGNPAPTTFGNTAPSTTFGAPSPAPLAFGAPSPAFGATSAPSNFSAPNAGGFGGTSAPGAFGGAPAFGASTEGGFSVGAAPQSKRRILRAKPRTKRA